MLALMIRNNLQPFKIGTQRLCSQMASGTAATELQYKEIKIPVPWGHIAAKEWGKADGRPVLGLHGWQDNSNTFDRLVPFLPEDVHFVAVDLPGHGLSSWIPKGTFYDIITYVSVVERVVRFLEWDTFSILAHSMGANIAFGYAGCFPHKVRKMVALDVLVPMQTEENMVSIAGYRIDQYLQQEKREVIERSVTLDTLIEVLLDVTGGSLTKDSARILLTRGARLVETSANKADCRFVVTRDRRLAMSTSVMTEDQVLLLAKKIRCDYLIIRASDGMTFTKRYSEEQRKKFFEVIRANAKSFEMVTVQGSHHVHLNSPERVASILQKCFASG